MPSARRRRRLASSTLDLLIRGALSGVFLGYATSLALVAVSQGVPAIVGAIIFPVGFVMLVLLGLELATGNFCALTDGLDGGPDWDGRHASELDLGLCG